MHRELFVDRQTERATLDEMVKALRGEESRVLVVHGVPGVGKTALIDYAERAAGGIRVLSAAGIESEMELPFAALHQICLPLLDRMPVLPVPRREALELDIHDGLVSLACALICWRRLIKWTDQRS